MNDLTLFFCDQHKNKVFLNCRFVRLLELNVSSEKLQLYRVVAHDCLNNEFHLTKRIPKAKAEEVLAMLRNAVAERAVLLEIPEEFAANV